MLFPITLVAAGLLGLMYVGLSFNVVRYRLASKITLGDGGGRPGTEALCIAIRAHGNFQEYVPLALILLGGIEMAGAPRLLVLILAAALVISRFLHAIGLTMKVPNLPRAVGLLGTLIVILVASMTALVLAL
jgi:uncharacterized membrane protein YecN with MAPEG domain